MHEQDIKIHVLDDSRETYFNSQLRSYCHAFRGMQSLAGCNHSMHDLPPPCRTAGMALQVRFASGAERARSMHNSTEETPAPLQGFGINIHAAPAAGHASNRQALRVLVNALGGKVNGKSTQAPESFA